MKLQAIRELAATLPVRHLLGEDGSPYLSRYKLHGWMPDNQVEVPSSVYLHNIHRHDLDEALHSHPWEWSQATALWGGYEEERGLLKADGSLLRLRNRELFAGRSLLMNADDLHRIKSVQPDTWTIFMVGSKRSSWGFYVEGRGMVPWRERLAERGVKIDYPPTPRELELEGRA